ncbi:neurogenic locus notch homolog protein 4-like, partial [Actinia tenebrosa]|uniref:Neurogenic locus notch homolog protein 4-like n=1 Tax=Actinia tenebrosa TaxID=6105 RepID=A0A6P8HY35_ACTTE
MLTETESLCRIMCYNTDTCVSYNYKKDSTACDLNDSDHIQHPQDFVKQSGYVYVGTENACQNSPCHKNSACRTNIRDETKPHWCVCPPGFRGPSCSKGIDECQTSSSSKCPEFSTCQNTNGSFHCQCNVGYKLNDSKCVV